MDRRRPVPSFPYNPRGGLHATESTLTTHLQRLNFLASERSPLSGAEGLLSWFAVFALGDLLVFRQASGALAPGGFFRASSALDWVLAACAAYFRGVRCWVCYSVVSACKAPRGGTEGGGERWQTPARELTTTEGFYFFLVVLALVGLPNTWSVEVAVRAFLNQASSCKMSVQFNTTSR